MDVISAVCPNCHILLVQADSDSITNLGASVNAAASAGANVIEIGWYVNEFSGESADDNAYFNHKGIAIVAASAWSTTGADGYGLSGYPAASPYVTAVGGTVLKPDSAPADAPRGWSETVWAKTGSRCSADEKAPAWQPASLCSNGMRAHNDMAADADASTGVAVTSDSVWYVEGGTGVAAAIVAGAYALAGQAGSGDYPAAYPYQHPGGSYLTPGDEYPFSEGLNDISEGHNTTQVCAPEYLCVAGYGYDAPSGLGSPEGTTSLTASGDLSGLIRSVGGYNMCMYANGSATKPSVEAEPCDFQTSQESWTLGPDGLLNGSGMCAVIPGGQTHPPVPITMNSACNSLASNQEWQSEANGWLVNPHSNLCLTDPGGGTGQLEAESCTQSSQMEWSLPYSMPGSSGQIISAVRSSPPLCINNESGKWVNGNTIQALTCQPNQNHQQWTVEPGGVLRYTHNDSFCLSVSGDGVQAGTPIVLWTCPDGASQEWVVRSDGSLINPASGLCLTDPDSGPSETQLELGTCTGAVDTLWTLPAG
jgi:hypothetical protein